MLKIIAIVRICTTIIILSIPVVIVLLYATKKSTKIIRNRIQNIQEHYELNIMEDFFVKKTDTTTDTQSTSTDNKDTKDIEQKDEKGDIRQNQLTDNQYEQQPPTKEPIDSKHKKILEKIKFEALYAKEKGKIEEFERKLVEGLAIDPDNIEFNQMLADFYFTLGNYKKATSLLKKVIDQNPYDHKAIWQIGEIYLSKGEFETAELLIEKAISLQPNNPKYYISMVEVYYNTNRKKSAIETLEKVVKLRPTTVTYLHALADLYMEINDIENAQKYYFRALEQEPSNTVVKAKLQKLKG